jgi:hypothetical protein
MYTYFVGFFFYFLPGWTPTNWFPVLGRRHYIAALLPGRSLRRLNPTPHPPLLPPWVPSPCAPPVAVAVAPQPPAMACLTDLVNLNLSDTTEKIIAEYIWYGARFRLFASHSLLVGKSRCCRVCPAALSWRFPRPRNGVGRGALALFFFRDQVASSVHFPSKNLLYLLAYSPMNI